MSDMKLEWQLEERRSDELGVLENSLNTLSRKLSATLEELQSANLQLQKDIEHQKVLERAQQDLSLIHIWTERPTPTPMKCRMSITFSMCGSRTRPFPWWWAPSWTPSRRKSTT